MAQAQLEIRSLTGPDMVTACLAVKTGITDHATIFTTPAPTMVVLGQKLTAAQDAINAAIQANEAARNAAIVRRQALAELADTAEQLVPYVQTVSGGDEAIIALAAMQVRKTPEPVGELPAPTTLAVRNNGLATTAKLKWPALYGAKYYIVELAKALNGVPTEAFHVVDQPTRANTEITELLVATEYQFRVRGVGTAGPGPWSPTVSKIIGA